MIYFTADHHFGHKNIIKHCNRPFDGVGDMEKQLIKAWNYGINDNDLIYFLGDFAHTLSNAKVRSILSKLKGKKVMIMGNHDRHLSKEKWETMGFIYASEEPIILDNQYLLSHEPITGSQYINIHGHTHNHKTNPTNTNRRFCVSVEMTNYHPISLRRLEHYLGIKQEEELSCL